ASPTIGEQASYKLGSPIGPVGTISFDGAYGVAGTLGAAPASIKVGATVRDAGGTVVQQLGSSVVDERSIRGGDTTMLLPLAAAATAGTALQKATSQVAIAGAARACTTIFLKAPEKPLEQCVDTVVPTATSQGGVETGIAEAVAGAVAPVTSAERFLGLVDRVAVDIRFRREADSAEIVKISAPKRPKAGSTVTVKVTVVQGTSGLERIIPVKVRIPRYASGEATGIVVIADAIEAAAPVDGESLTDLFVDEDEPIVPKNLAALRALYTPAGISGLRAAVIPGIPGAALKGGLLGDEDSELDDADLADLAKHTKLAWELPSVSTTGLASATVYPR
ncbi:MAG: hypothetical protein Q7T55_10555, partial [Solirubrobacteraceae bacterium]|nr:hypothetical protein [Solirubrobacteraceae bacterium]